ncbi:redox-regulated ATPase YchF [Candidatus Falkowbacteria bacterium]|uniref:Ribosome-binding ATPase YchF n=1 Tax=Candidatus Falkowbacteria bacterium CG10_big_fil_rev_8_21_14_0_10_37_18 TaxID=1974562 RepID=A0A2H0V9V2_9BACT|nr:redox-regulated ATPase YchF [Candidatus Falkowbacteria bacterium]NCQ12931.1 redox-regulated ATPase YchF [Candidatus Falkowbacteria bacterium]OIO05949.1 MAG: redox-regulated ATPase YchF [Candidatus Falkowbacteria bacterium CG1_02_37_21]PIR95864.1 MAG: redox-regulated ATPase YchF [Candidatus Falkowbacteria bacterium CG10_big_fil_rev_8_21_14_0_10_37_18]
MSLSIAIVGLPNVGKSTLFNILTKKSVEAANYPFCTIDPNIGIVKVPDFRLDRLAAVSKPAKIINTTIEFVDIAGLVAGAHKGEGLGNKFLSHIRECDAICEVVRDFKDENVIHVQGRVDPSGDKETINLELIFADLATVEKSLEKNKRDAKSGDKEIIHNTQILEKIYEALAAGKAVRELSFSEDDQIFVKTLNLLSIKPIIYLLNIDENHSDDVLSGTNDLVIKVNVQLEQEIASLPEEEQAEYIKELGLEQSGLDKLIQSAYKILGLETFFTTGADETRAWTIKKGAKAPQAAGEIHTDFIKGFIRAEVINWEKFVECGSETKAKELGLIRTEGKEYIFQDGDVANFLVNK